MAFNDFASADDIASSSSKSTPFWTGQACPVQKGVDFDDDEAMSSAEAKSLNAMIPVMKRSRKQFANSSGLQQFLKNLS